MKEPWSTRWYTPILVLALMVVGLLILALIAVQVLVAAAPDAIAPQAWTPSLDRVDEALREGDLAAALAWWREARIAAVRSGQWEGLIDVGDASRRLGDLGGLRRDADAHAREAYLGALLRARRQRSLEGVLRAAVGFGELGDREVTAYALWIAERQAGRDPDALARVKTVADRWTKRARGAGSRNLAIPGGGEQP